MFGFDRQKRQKYRILVVQYQVETAQISVALDLQLHSQSTASFLIGGKNILCLKDCFDFSLEFSSQDFIQQDVHCILTK